MYWCYSYLVIIHQDILRGVAQIRNGEIKKRILKEMYHRGNFLKALTHELSFSLNIFSTQMDTPLWMHPPSPPQPQEDRRSTGGRYESYWDAYLFLSEFSLKDLSKSWVLT